MNNILITSRLEDGTFTSNARNAIQEDFWWHWANTILILMNEKYNTNGIKNGSSKNINLLKVKRRHSWMQWSNKIQQHSCWCPVNRCYKCAKRKIIASKLRHKKAILWGSLFKDFSKVTAHESSVIHVQWPYNSS